MKRILVGLLSLAVLGWFTISVVAQPPEKGPPGQGQRGGFEKGGQDRGGRGGFDQDKGPPGGGRGGRMGGPGFELGRIIPPPMRQQLELTEDQVQQLDNLEQELKDKLNKLLTADQKKQLENMRNRGPGGPGGPGGPPNGLGGDNRKDGPGRGKDSGNRPPPDKEKDRD